ncbi:MAG: carbamoyltransferase C-terminal domain-containing protein [Candidatus Micrarchaeaceae archaeon]
MYTLGVWDGHESGAALLHDDKIVYAANEERFTRRKTELRFPVNSIMAALAYAKIKPGEVEKVTFTTTEFIKTLERIFPAIKENYYLFRRRKMLKPRPWDIRHNHWLKYLMTSIGVLPGGAFISKAQVARELGRLGFNNYKLEVVEHHVAHAATAAFTSGYKKALVITLDGLGDGICGSISTLENGKLERHKTIKAADSIGIFYEQVTNILGMRELEDEGKIMAMADYSYPFNFNDNKFKDFFKVEGTSIKAKYGWLRQFDMIDRIAWQTPREQVAYMAQQLLEKVLTEFVQNAIDEFGIGNVVFAGGVFSNVKANMALRKLDGLKHWYVFPHMGDGGLALGGVLYTNYLDNGVSDYSGFNAYLGNEYGEDETETLLKKEAGLEIQHESAKESASHAAELISHNNYLFWFQGRMEYGPRALGNRSILAPSGSEEVKDKLNLYVKKREWFQPFAPSILEEDCSKIFHYDNKGVPRYMTMAYDSIKERSELLKAVVHIDGTGRPQAVGGENPTYRDVLRKIKKETGYGIMLNTSFNIHGEPIVMSPQDAIRTMKVTNTKYMFINGLFVENKKGI